ncbi:cyclin-dependent kinase regulator pho80 [Pyrenophora seminiperda CCB06]|uniref:Cyclin-dependent kinase regulator pho80 n=1 Tax=Pyrenophora seminiperda CCB06 TaxID=1302712 RepID=A0A3M7MB30_9PLEO|nr:cyclin-dependent kinase regulator pho80 [Pyrenophora seminiperda CCB06]
MTIMLLSKLLLLPFAVASSVTLYVSSVPASVSADTAIVASPIPLAQIEYNADQSVGTLASYTPPTGSYSPEHLLRVGLTDSVSGPWRGVLTSAASFSDQYHKKFVIHVDEKGEPYHIGFRTRVKGSEEEVEVEIVKKNDGPKPVLNKPIVLNADGKIDGKEVEKTFLQKYWWALALFLVVQLVAGGGGEK